MIKLFIKGIVFGSGFSIALLAFGFITYTILNNQELEDTTYTGAELDAWNKMGEMEKVREAKAIAIINYKQISENHHLAYISEIYKKPNVETGLSVGDPLPTADSYASKGSVPSGAIAFFIGNPASVSSVTMLYDDLAKGFGDMPAKAIIEIFNQNLTKP